MSARTRAYEIPGSLLDDISDGRTTLAAAAGTIGCSRTEIQRALRRYGRDRRTALTKTVLRKLYVQRGMTCPQIAAETGGSSQTIRARLKEFGIARCLGPPRAR